MPRKLTASFYMSLDGIVDAPQEWHFPHVDDEMMADAAGSLGESDTILLGRKTYEEWAAFWPGQGDGNPMAEYFNGTPKVVASTTLDRLDWQNSTLISSDVATTVYKLKGQPGKNISVTGSGTLVRSLLRAQLVDELRLMVHPIVVGHGKRLFDSGDERSLFELAESKVYSTGVLSLTYTPAPA